MEPPPGGLGRSIEEHVSSYGFFHYRPEPASAEEAELTGIGRTTSRKDRDKAREEARRAFFQSLFTEMGGPRFWALPTFFCALQLACLSLAGESLFGLLTGGVVESVHLVRTGMCMRWHMLGGMATWLLAALQFLARPLRHGRLACVHRGLGRVYLLLWLLLVGPSSAFLSLFSGTGPGRAQLSMTLFALVSLDTTLFAYYYLWRGWAIMRRRASGDSAQLHRKAMAAGTFFTMTILWQRPLQAGAFVAPRFLLLRAAELLGVGWLREAAALVLDHNVGLAISTVFIGFPAVLLDGPHSWVARSVMALPEAQALEFYGAAQPHRAELLCWRLRHVAWLVLRGVVTRGWSKDPDS